MLWRGVVLVHDFTKAAVPILVGVEITGRMDLAGFHFGHLLSQRLWRVHALIAAAIGRLGFHQVLDQAANPLHCL